MKATCKANHIHSKFVTTQHVMEEIVVDSEGGFVDTVQTLEVTHRPDPGNYWTCYECGSDATVEE